MKPALETKQGAWFLPYDPTPSQEDIHVTRRLVESGKMIGIEMLDHLVIGNRKFVSLKEKGYL